MSLRELINKHQEFKKRGIRIVAFFGSSREEILKYAGKQKAPFPIIPDPDYSVYNQYGIGISYTGMMKTMFSPRKVYKAIRGGFFSVKSTFQDPVLPADFLIDEIQSIVRVHYGKTYDDHLDVSEVLEWKSIKLAAAV